MDRAVVRHGRGQGETREGNDEVDGCGDVGSSGHVVNPQEVKTGQQTAEHGARGVAAVEESPPVNAGSRPFHPANHNGERSAHQDGGRKQTDTGERRAEQHAGEPMFSADEINSI